MHQNEIEKIPIYSKHPTLEDVQNLLVVEPMNDIFKMVDAFFSQNGILLLAYYRNFRKLNIAASSYRCAFGKSNPFSIPSTRING